MNLSETFTIDVNMDFANTNHGGFLIKAPKKIRAQNLKKAGLYWGLCSRFFEGLNQNSAMVRFAKSILILKISDKFMEKCRRSRLFGDSHLGKMEF